MKHYFYTLKALWDGQGKIKMNCGMSRVKKPLSGKRSIMQRNNIFLIHHNKTITTRHLYSSRLHFNKRGTEISNALIESIFDIIH